MGVHAVGARSEGDVILGYDSFRPSTFVDAFRFMYDNPSLMWTKIVEHLAISGEAMGIALLIAIGLGVFGIGTTNVAFALVILAFPLILTNAYVGVDGVDPDAIEAARGMGMRPYQIVLKIELPLALPLIFAGIKTAAVYVVATATLGGVVGGGGLGDIIVNQASYFLKGVIAASIAVAALAFAASFAFGLLQWAVTPRGLRRRGIEMIELDVSTGVAEAATT